MSYETQSPHVISFSFLVSKTLQRFSILFTYYSYSLVSRLNKHTYRKAVYIFLVNLCSKVPKTPQTLIFQEKSKKNAFSSNLKVLATVRYSAVKVVFPNWPIDVSKCKKSEIKISRKRNTKTIKFQKKTIKKRLLMGCVLCDT